MPRWPALVAILLAASCAEGPARTDPADAGDHVAEDAGADARPDAGPAEDAGCGPLPEGQRWDDCWGAWDCKRAWKVGLSPCDETPDDYLAVRKSARNVALCRSGELVESFQAGLGFAPVGDKEEEGDGKTPEGVFYVAALVPNSSYYKAFLMSYPDGGDAERGVKDGLITRSERDAIVAAQARCEVPPQTTQLGSWLEVHGKGGSRDWTLGCIAVDSKAMDKLWAVIERGDTIVVLP